MARMVDIAKKAGVSIKTVSRVLNREPHVTETLRARVQSAVDELGYVPSASARRLRSHRSFTIHLVSHSLRSNYVNAIQFGAMQVCQERGYQLMVSLMEDLSALDAAAVEDRVQPLFESGKPDGIILVPPLSNDSRLTELLDRHEVAVARIGPSAPGDKGIRIEIDERSAARDQTRRLLELGHRRIGFIRGKEDQNATHERYAGYVDALQEAGIVVDENLVQPGDFDFSSGLEAGRILLSRKAPPTAIFAGNDDMAAGAIMAAHRLGLSLPANLSIVGFDDSEIAEKTWPALTTVRQPVLEFGRIAAERLIDTVSKPGGDGAATLIRLDYALINRESAAPAG